ncbi:hypothetical protein DL98DRAFT_527664 [Cadophora sp. DSE1049]|nr:hypothetical protein DL98DRAFT_527664 [Cadophora sp. DSE1049]
MSEVSRPVKVLLPSDLGTTAGIEKVPAKVFSSSLAQQHNLPDMYFTSPDGLSDIYDVVHDSFKETFVKNALTLQWVGSPEYEQYKTLLKHMFTHAFTTISEHVKHRKIDAEIYLTTPASWGQKYAEKLREIVQDATAEMAFDDPISTPTIEVKVVLSEGKCSSFASEIADARRGNNKRWIEPGEMLGVLDLGGNTADLTLHKHSLDLLRWRLDRIKGIKEDESFEESPPFGIKLIHDQIIQRLTAEISQCVPGLKDHAEVLRAIERGGTLVTMCSQAADPDQNRKWLIELAGLDKRPQFNKLEGLHILE